MSQQQLPSRSSCLWEFLHLSFTSQCCPKILGTTIQARNLFQDNSTKGKSLTFTLFIPVFNSLALQNPQNLSGCFRPKAHPGRGKTIPPWKLFTGMQHPVEVFRDSFARIPSEDSRLKEEINSRGWAGEGKAYQVFIHPKPGARKAGRLEVPRGAGWDQSSTSRMPQALQGLTQGIPAKPQGFPVVQPLRLTWVLAFWITSPLFWHKVLQGFPEMTCFV